MNLAYGLTKHHVIMKNLQLLQFLFLCLLTFSCNSEDDNSSTTSLDPGITITVNGGSYNNYTFLDGIYSVTKGNNGSTLSIDAGDSNGDLITLFFNSKGGF